MRSLSEDLRVRIIRARQRGEGSAAVAARFEVNIRTVQKLWKRYQETGSTLPGQHGGHRQSRLAPMESEIRAWIAQEVDITLAELCDRLADRGIEIKVPALWHQLNKWELTYKKNAARQRTRSRRRASGTG